MSTLVAPPPVVVTGRLDAPLPAGSGWSSGCWPCRTTSSWPSLTDADLRTHDLGRCSREVTPALRELLGALDGERCRMPGCTRRRKLHAHHARFWSDGGPTDLANLVKREYDPPTTP